MRPPTQTRAALAAVAVLLFGCGCASTAPRYFVNPQADMVFYKKVAVLPFANLSPSPLAGERVTRAFVTELIIADRYQVIEPGEFKLALEKAGADPAPDGTYDPGKLKEAATQVEAKGVIRGAVTDYQTQRNGQDEYPVLTFDVELLDTDTGNVVWRAAITRRGKPRFPVFGGSSTLTLGRLTQEACVEMVEGLQRRGF
jgi:hypothetical protein